MPRIPRWKRQIRPTPRERASGNGSRGETPCAGAGAALAPARVWAAAQAQHNSNEKKEQKKREFPSGCPASAMETAGMTTPMEPRQQKQHAPSTRREQPHPTSLRSATFPKGEGCAARLHPCRSRTQPIRPDSVSPPCPDSFLLHRKRAADGLVSGSFVRCLADIRSCRFHRRMQSILPGNSGFWGERGTLGCRPDLRRG